MCSQFDNGDYGDRFSDFYKYIAALDEGAFGTVVKAINRSDNEEIAVKVTNKQNLKNSTIVKLRKEGAILAQLDHPCVVKLKHQKETNKRMFLALELVHGTNLQKYIHNRTITENKARGIIQLVLQGLAHIHTNNVIHRDLKPENILISQTKPLQVKIIDFGLSALVDQEDPLGSEECGTLIYMAPEQRFNQYYSQAVDVWSCGVILYMLLTQGTHPFAVSTDTAETYILKLKNPVKTFPAYFPEQAKSLFCKMTELAPLERYTATAALSHPWVTNEPSEVPLTVFERFLLDSDVLKLKCIALSLVFYCIVVPSETKRQTLVPVVKITKNTVTSLSKRPMPTRRISSRKSPLSAMSRYNSIQIPNKKLIFRSN